MESTIVVAHGAMSQSQYGVTAERRLQKAMEDAVLQCNAEGIANAHENSDVIRRRMHQAHDRELIVITKETYDAQVTHLNEVHKLRREELDRLHEESLAQAALGLREELAAIEARIRDA
jgi:hypothetical protein